MVTTTDESYQEYLKRTGRPDNANQRTYYDAQVELGEDSIDTTIKEVARTTQERSTALKNTSALAIKLGKPTPIKATDDPKDTQSFTDRSSTVSQALGISTGMQR